MTKIRSAYNIYDAKNGLSELIERAKAGEEIIIMNRGEPVARLVPLEKVRSKAQLGFAKGSSLRPGWDRPLEDFEDHE
ncbi:MAG: type II toxin-antitoxin system prevent-host-death family antitoxin [Bdellovibrionota bacterium]